MNLFLLFSGLLLISSFLLGCLESTPSVTPEPCDNETNETTLAPTPSALPGVTINQTNEGAGACSV